MTSGKIKFKMIKKFTKKWEEDFKNFYKGCLLPSNIKKIGTTYFAAYFGNILAGHSAIIKEKDRWVLEGLRVRPEFREKGIATKLTELRIAYAITNGAKSIWYMDFDKNLVSLCCHIKFGFKKAYPKTECKIKDTVWYKLDITPEIKEKYKKSLEMLT